MTIKQSEADAHWSYFLAIERDLEVVSRYIEFDRRNFECFSIELARVLLAAASEVDVVCKTLCRELPGPPKSANIEDYRSALAQAYPRLPTFIVTIPRFGLELKPWSEWVDGGIPFWWTAYNKTKHERSTEYHRATLQNALNAVAALYVVQLYLY